MKNFTCRLLIVAICVMSMASCKAHKKPKCNTCPKWEDRVNIPGREVQ